MKITQRLEGRARAVARAARSLGDDLAADGPAAAYARLLDGERLWLAVPAGAGRPALWDERDGHLVEPADDLPGDHVEHDPSCRSVRWRVTEIVPEEEDAELLLVVVPDDGGKPAPLRPAPRPPASHLRIPPTSDGEWRFAMRAGEDGFLRVRRTRAARVVRLLDVELAGAAVTLTCTARQDGPVQLLFLAKHGEVAHALPTERTPDGVVARLTAADLPPAPGGYRLAVGRAGDQGSVVRRQNDLLVEESTSVLMPLLLDPETGQVAGRLQFNTQGVLRLVRQDVTQPDDTEDDTGTEDDTEDDAEAGDDL